MAENQTKKWILVADYADIMSVYREYSGWRYGEDDRYAILKHYDLWLLLDKVDKKIYAWSKEVLRLPKEYRHVSGSFRVAYFKSDLDDIMALKMETYDTVVLGYITEYFVILPKKCKQISDRTYDCGDYKAYVFVGAPTCRGRITIL